MSRLRHILYLLIFCYCDFLEGGWLSTLDSKRVLCLHVRLDCENRLRHEAQR